MKLLPTFRRISPLRALALLVTACAPAAAPSPTASPPAKPTEAAKPAAAAPTTAPAAPTAAAAKPADKPAAAASGPAKTLKVGVAQPQSGSGSYFGEKVGKGIVLAAEEIEKGNLLPGVKLDVITADSQCAPLPATNAATKLIKEDNVEVILGESCSSATIAIKDIVGREKVPLLNAGSSSIKITEEGNPYTFRILPNEVMQNSLMAEKAVNELKLKRFVTAYETTDAGIGNNKAFVDRAQQLGAEVLDQIAIDRELADFNPIAARIKSLNPDGLPHWMLEGQMVKLAKAVKEAGVQTQPLSTIWSPVSFEAKAGDAADGYIRALQFWAGDPGALQQKFTTTFKAKFNEEPDHLNAQGYDQMMLVVDAIKRGGPDREGIRKGFAETKGWKGVMGTVTIDAKGQNTEMDAMRWVKTLPGGKLELLKW